MFNLIDRLNSVPGREVVGRFAVVMLVIFLPGFVLDFIEITFTVVPIAGSVLLAIGSRSNLAGYRGRRKSAVLIPHATLRFALIY